MFDLIFLVGGSIVMLGAFIYPFVYSSKQAEKRKIEREKRIKTYIDSLSKEWSKDEVGPRDRVAQAIITRNVVPGMLEEMVSLAWGKPKYVDRTVHTEKYYQERWVYGTPRRGAGANYIILRNKVVTKVEQNFRPPQDKEVSGFANFVAALFLSFVVAVVVGGCYIVLASEIGPGTNLP